MKLLKKENLSELDLISSYELEWYAKNGTVIKRSLWIAFFDIFLAIVGILLMCVPMLVIAVAIKIDSRGPFFIIQERLGQFKKPIRIIKFRTMVINAEENGLTWAKENDVRVTKVGKILRKIRLDEIPQLINVLKGDMSFVGPRPIRKYFADFLQSYNSSFDKRFLIKPGITGWAQIYAPYGSTVEEQLMKLPYDLRYLRGLSVKDYFKIILLTIKVVLLGKGI